MQVHGATDNELNGNRKSAAARIDRMRPVPPPTWSTTVTLQLSTSSDAEVRA